MNNMRAHVAQCREILSQQSPQLNLCLLSLHTNKEGRLLLSVVVRDYNK